MAKKTIEMDNVRIIDEAQAEYETVGDFEYFSKEQALKMEAINELVEKFGEEIISRFERVWEGSKMFREGSTCMLGFRFGKGSLRF